MSGGPFVMPMLRVELDFMRQEMVRAFADFQVSQLMDCKAVLEEALSAKSIEERMRRYADEAIEVRVRDAVSRASEQAVASRVNRLTVLRAILEAAHGAVTEEENNLKRDELLRAGWYGTSKGRPEEKWIEPTPKDPTTATGNLLTLEEAWAMHERKRKGKK